VPPLPRQRRGMPAAALPPLRHRSPANATSTMPPQNLHDTPAADLPPRHRADITTPTTPRYAHRHYHPSFPSPKRLTMLLATLLPRCHNHRPFSPSLTTLVDGQGKYRGIGWAQEMVEEQAGELWGNLCNVFFSRPFFTNELRLAFS